MTNIFTKKESTTSRELYTFIADLEDRAEDMFLELLTSMDEIYLHTYERYIHRLDKVYDKVKDGSLSDRAKIADSIIKSITSTIMKWSACDELKVALDIYLSGFFEKHEFHVGQKLQDEDWSYIEEQPLTDDYTPHHVICKVYNQAYSLPYYDEEDEELYRRIISASIVFGK